MIRVAFRFGDTRRFARLISWWDGSDVAHCEVAGYWTGDVHECVSASWLDGGVRAKNMPLPADKWRIYEMAGDPRHVDAWLGEHDGQGYDWLGLLGFMWRPIRGMLGRKLCSEACAEMVGIRDGWRFGPAMLEAIVARFGRRVQ